LIARDIALLALVTLGLSGMPCHEPCHVGASNVRLPQLSVVIGDLAAVMPWAWKFGPTSSSELPDSETLDHARYAPRLARCVYPARPGRLDKSPAREPFALLALWPLGCENFLYGLFQGRAPPRLAAPDRARGQRDKLACSTESRRDAPTGTRHTTGRPLFLPLARTTVAAEARTSGQLAASAGRRMR